MKGAMKTLCCRHRGSDTSSTIIHYLCVFIYAFLSIFAAVRPEFPSNRRRAKICVTVEFPFLWLTICVDQSCSGGQGSVGAHFKEWVSPGQTPGRVGLEREDVIIPHYSHLSTLATNNCQIGF